MTDYRLPIIATFNRIRIKTCHRKDETGREIYRLSKENIADLKQEIADEQPRKRQADPRVVIRY